MPRLASVLIVALTLACGPKEPDSATTDTTSASTTSTPSSPGAPATTTGDDSTGAATSTTTSASTGVTATTELAPCIVSPANDICSAACDAWDDCCACNGRTFLPDPMPSTCTLAMGVVTSLCAWAVSQLSIDGEVVTDQGVSPCDAATSGWAQSFQDGDNIIELCGQTCTDYLAGKFQMLKAEMFCEAA